MTNPTKETLELVREVASKLWPEHDWKIVTRQYTKDDKCNVVGWFGNPFKHITSPQWSYYEPNMDTGAGKIHLMDLIFRLCAKGELNLNQMNCKQWYAQIDLPANHEPRLYDSGDTETLAEAILKLAVEVL